MAATSTTPSADLLLDPDQRVAQGEQRITHGEDYNSHNTKRLDVEGMKQLLLKLDFMKRIARGEAAMTED